MRRDTRRDETIEENRTTTEAILTWPETICTRGCVSATHRPAGVKLVA